MPRARRAQVGTRALNSAQVGSRKGCSSSHFDGTWRRGHPSTAACSGCSWVQRRRLFNGINAACRTYHTNAVARPPQPSNARAHHDHDQARAGSIPNRPPISWKEKQKNNPHTPLRQHTGIEKQHAMLIQPSTAAGSYRAEPPPVLDKVVFGLRCPDGGSLSHLVLVLRLGLGRRRVRKRTVDACQEREGFRQLQLLRRESTTERCVTRPAERKRETRLAVTILEQLGGVFESLGLTFGGKGCVFESSSLTFGGKDGWSSS